MDVTTARQTHRFFVTLWPERGAEGDDTETLKWKWFILFFLRK